MRLPNTPNTGNTFRLFLLGSVSSATFTTLSPTTPALVVSPVFCAGRLRATHNLTVSVGLRYSVETPAQTKYGFKSEFNPNVVDPLTGMMGAITHPKGSAYGTTSTNFAPRLGLSWNFMQKWVFRGSFGIFTEDVMPELGMDEYLATAASNHHPEIRTRHSISRRGPGQSVTPSIPQLGRPIISARIT